MGPTSGRVTRLLNSPRGTDPAQDVPPRLDDRGPEVMDAEHRRLVMIGLEAVRNGDIASEEEIEAVLARPRS